MVVMVVVVVVTVMGLRGRVRPSVLAAALAEADSSAAVAAGAASLPIMQGGVYVVCVWLLRHQDYSRLSFTCELHGLSCPMKEVKC